MTPKPFAGGLTVVTIAVLAWRWRRSVASWGWLDRAAVGLLVVAVFTLWLLAVTVVFDSVRSDWNGARLLPTFSLVAGYRLYYPATEGPVTNHVYGPIAAFAFLPAAMFRTPTPAILAGAALQVLFVFAPLLTLVWRAGAGRNRLTALACGLGACLLMARYRGTAYWITMVHADGPSLAFGLLACAALVTREGRAPTTRALVVSATAAVLSCWTKQTAAPLPVALLLAVLLGHGRVSAVRYGVALAGIGAAVSLAMLAWGGEAMLFNMFTLVSRHRWLRPGLGGLVGQVRMLGVAIWDVLLAFALVLAATLATGRDRRRLLTRAWIAPLLAAILLLPTGALGANKFGGGQNSFHSVYYLIAALAALLVEGARSTAIGRVIAYAFCAVAIASAWRSERVHLGGRHALLWQNDHQQAFEFAARHPGEAYFPWQPLASLLAEGRLYHFEYGLWDRHFASFDVDDEHLRRHLPPRLRWIAARQRSWTFDFVPELSQPVRVPELPRWVVNTRPPP